MLDLMVGMTLGAITVAGLAALIRHLRIDLCP
jgi:hypothetical protein